MGLAGIHHFPHTLQRPEVVAAGARLFGDALRKCRQNVNRPGRLLHGGCGRPLKAAVTLELRPMHARKVAHTLARKGGVGLGKDFVEAERDEAIHNGKLE